MSDVQSAFPRRDDAGRITGLGDLSGMSLAGVVVGVLALVLFDWAFALVGMGAFGRANGWLAVILPAWLFVEEFRAWGPGPARVAAALVATAVGLAAGLLAAGLLTAGLASALSPLWSGASAAALFALSYSLVWYFGVRWLERRTG